MRYGHIYLPKGVGTRDYIWKNLIIQLITSKFKLVSMQLFGWASKSQADLWIGSTHCLQSNHILLKSDIQMYKNIYHSKHYFVNTHVWLDDFSFFFFLNCELCLLACTTNTLKESVLSSRDQTCILLCVRKHTFYIKSLECTSR